MQCERVLVTCVNSVVGCDSLVDFWASACLVVLGPLGSVPSQHVR